MLQDIVTVFQQEFADLPDVKQATQLFIRLGLAAILGGLLGWERERSGQSAGLRTHMLVAMGASLFVAVGQLAGGTPAESSRILQGVIAGVGFLGAGTILKPSNAEAQSEVRGLTTAAGIWFTAAIGVACGLGEESTALISALLALLILNVAPYLARSANKKHDHTASRQDR